MSDTGPHPPVVAIDGPAGSGKSTIARIVADRLRLPYVDTGAMYRAVTWAALDAGVDLGDTGRIGELANAARIQLGKGGEVRIDGREVTQEIRGAEVTEAVSTVSAIPSVRETLVRLQRQMASEGGVLEGRDIGTVVFPRAPVKIYLDATPEERARRRSAQVGGADVDAVVSAIRRRDQLDSGREASPMKPADDAFLLDTTDLEVEEVVERILQICAEKGIRVT